MSDAKDALQRANELLDRIDTQCRHVGNPVGGINELKLIIRAALEAENERLRTQLSPVQSALTQEPKPVKCKACGKEYDFYGKVDGLGWMKRCMCDV